MITSSVSLALPGDTVIYRNKEIYIKPACPTKENCAELMRVEAELQGKGEYFQQSFPLERFTESLGDIEHDVLRNPVIPSMERDYYRQPGTRIDEWIVPEGQYFVLGDNRDNSRDGRYWGFVPDENLVGKAVAIWISFEFERDPSSWLPGWVPTGVRFERVGGIQ